MAFIHAVGALSISTWLSIGATLISLTALWLSWLAHKAAGPQVTMEVINPLLKAGRRGPVFYIDVLLINRGRGDIDVGDFELQMSGIRDTVPLRVEEERSVVRTDNATGAMGA